MSIFRVTAVLALLGSLGLGLTLQEQEEQKLPDKRTFMQRKVDFTKNIVEALATENYEAIGKSAQDLILISNESNWNAFQTPEYIEMSREFRIAAERLRGSAKEKNIDSATLNYFELTMSCVRCHKYLRQKQHK